MHIQFLYIKNIALFIQKQFRTKIFFLLIILILIGGYIFNGKKIYKRNKYSIKQNNENKKY